MLGHVLWPRVQDKPRLNVLDDPFICWWWWEWPIYNKVALLPINCVTTNFSYIWVVGVDIWLWSPKYLRTIGILYIIGKVFGCKIWLFKPLQLKQKLTNLLRSYKMSILSCSMCQYVNVSVWSNYTFYDYSKHIGI